MMPKKIITLQDPPSIPSQTSSSSVHITSTSARVKFYHPAYDKKDGLLFVLHGYDDDGEDAKVHGGIHYGLAFDTCAIIADNHYDGWLTATQHGARIEADWDDILPVGSYWYHIPGPMENPAESSITPPTPYRWPVVTCFQDFEFPEVLPPTWARVPVTDPPLNIGSQSTYSSLTRARDVTCRITSHSTGVQVAHICPEHEREWFVANAMSQYNSDILLDPKNLLNDPTNLLLLRADLHAAFDDRKFILYPKGSGLDDFVVHMLQPTTDIGALYHNRRTQSILSCRIEFLYARFAWAVFPAISAFLCSSITKKAVITVKHGKGGRQRLVEELSDAGELRARASASRSRSPKKRQRQPALSSEVGEEEECQPTKRARNSFTSSAISALVQTPSDFDSAAPSPPVHLKGQSGFEQLKREYLCQQRPPGFKPFNGSVFEGTTDPKVILGRLGVEIQDDFPP